jgi:hypothetical protein
MSLIASVVELDRRAGASDEDRPAWLAERKGGITATELRDLMIHKISEKRLIDMKLGRKPESDWTGPYAAYGKEREPEIAREVAQRWNIMPETRLFHAADEPRFMCSPDGIGVNFDELIQGCEIKTAELSLAPWDPAFHELGYDVQCQWCMRVTGAKRWLLAHEERHGVPGDFWPGERHFHWIDRDDALIAEAERRARRFLEALDAARAEPWVPAEIDEELDTHAVNYLRFLAEENAAREAKQREWAALLAARKSQTSTLARVTFTPATSGEVEETDLEAAEAANPEIFAEMARISKAWDDHVAKFKKLVPVKGRDRLRVTAVKTKEME